MEFEQSVAVKNLDRRHTSWTDRATEWEKMSLLYEGGCSIKKNAQDFLTRRPKELEEVYAARLARFTYANHVGTATDWYLAAEFEKPPRVEASLDTPIAANVAEFYERFFNDCDRAGSSIVEMFSRGLKNVIVYGSSFILVDLPKKLQEYSNAAEERDAGQLDPFLCSYDPRQAVNWETDPYGNLNWIVFTVRKEESEPLGAVEVYDYWYFFDRESFAVYKRKVPKEEKKIPDDAVAELDASGMHGLAQYQTVPVIKLAVPEGMWLMNRAYLAAQDHLNTDNVLSWSLQMAALAMPVIKSDSNVEISLSEAGYIHLPADAEYGWSEPEGKSFVHLAERGRTLVEDIFRAFYLISQARSNEATPAAQSGVSKQQDMMPSKKMLNAFGDILRSGIQQAMNMVSLMRGDVVEWDVSGLEFPEDPVDGELKVVSTALTMDIPSLTVEQELYKKAVDSIFPDVNQDLRTKMHAEIDASPSREERLAKRMEDASGSITKRFGSAVTKS